MAFSCKGRWFCPSCHQKKVQLFGALLTETILCPVPHRHFTFGMPKMLRPYFRFDRDLLKDLCRMAHECLLEYLRTTFDLPDGLPGIVMLIHTFAVEKMQVSPANRANPDGSIIYCSGLHPKIQRNFELFTPCDFIAAITPHIPDKSFQLVRYYGWYSNKMRGQRDKCAAEEAKAAGQAMQVIDVSEHQPRRIPSAKWRELIKKLWEADPLLCPKCQREMRIVALIDDHDVIERILRHLGLWQQSVRVAPARAPPEIADRVIEPCFDDPFPDYDTEPPMAYANG